MRVFLALFLGAIVVFIGTQIYNLRSQKTAYDAELAELSAEASALSIENRSYEEDIQYYENPENLGKEALKYDRKRPGEDLYILVAPDDE